MTPAEFKRDWEVAGDVLVAFPESYVLEAPIPASAKQFLVEVGLPSDAAPCLSFGPRTRTWGLSEGLEIGFNGSGDPVAVMSDGSVCYLNHDRDFARCYVNRDLAALLETLLQLRMAISETQRLSGPDGYVDGRVPAHVRSKFTAFLQSSDSIALEPGSMWADEIAAWAD